LRRDGAAAQRWAEELIALSREHGLVQYLARGVLLRGGALVEQGQSEEGMAQIRQGLADTRATDAELGEPAWLVILATALARIGRVDEALCTLDKAGIARARGQFYEAELYRLKGRLTLQQESQKSKVKSQKSKVKSQN
jgi:predicted ATPase